MFYLTGKLKRQSNFVNKKQELSKEEKKFHELFSKGIVLMKAYDYTGAIKKLNEAIILNPDYADVYFSRGTADLNLGYELGDRSPMLLDTKNRYCK